MRIGTLEPGETADVLLLDFDPMAEPAAWRDPSKMSVVVQSGRVVADRRSV